MANALQQTARQEAEWVQRYSQMYRSRMAGLIDQVNRTLSAGPTGTEAAAIRPAERKDAAGQSIRCCLEAVDLMLSSQAEFAQVIDRWASQATHPVVSTKLRRAA